MDVVLEQKIKEAIDSLNRMVDDPVDYRRMDPVAKMMLVALLQECRKIEDYVEGIADRIVERFCESFIPQDKIAAVPAVAVVEPRFKSPRRNAEMVSLGDGVVFGYKTGTGKSTLNYMPLFRNRFLPYDGIYVLTPRKMYHADATYDIAMDKPHCMWIGIDTTAEVESLAGLSILIGGCNGMVPSAIRVGPEERRLQFSDMSRIDEIEMVEPFDAQQSSERFLSLVDHWRERLSNLDNCTLVYVTDEVADRDLFKPRAYPRVFQHWLESEILDCFRDRTLWLEIEFDKGYRVPDACTVRLNALPVVNVDVNSLSLTQSAPVAKLQKQEGSYFVQVLETSNAANRQGFNMTADEVIIRDFDASCYHDGDLYREVRNLYNRFIDDYYAFIEYNGIKDGEAIKLLRETINRIGKSVGTQNARYRFDSGTYAMKNMNRYPLSSSTRISYLTTSGKIGNTPERGETMENKKLPAMEKEVPILVSAAGGTDKAAADERYELLRYYTLTSDRLYTRKDIEAFLRKEIVAEFGQTEFRRICVRISIEGAAGDSGLRRGLYIDIEFRDKKNYDHAVRVAFDNLMRQKIEHLCCISMPIIVGLHNSEDL